jgi:lysophospholipase L1-like esterase
MTPAALAAPQSAPIAPRVPSCLVAAERASVSSPLVRTARKLADGLPIKIVALGSSSTYGFGASTPANSYPSRLADEIAQHRPGQAIAVLNRGLNNDEVAQTLNRLERDVIAENPDLILWQVGTNSLLRHLPLQTGELRKGLSRMKAIGSDVVLIDPQFVPAVIAAPDVERMVSRIAATAEAEQVGLFQRYALMRHWREIERLPFETFVTWDRLHMNDWGYGCLAKSIATAIVETAVRPLPAAVIRPTARR